ncbi:BnaA01g36070D [Brassica napus]|nr:BnaA01g36070D [Brassica napus]
MVASRYRLALSGSRSYPIVLFITTWVFFFIAEVCLLAGSVRNAYHTKYHVYFGNTAPSSRSLRKSVFGDWSCVHKQGLPPSFTTCA